MIFTLAALITAIITAHTQTVVYTPFQHVNLAPYIQNAGPLSAGQIGPFGPAGG